MGTFASLRARPDTPRRMTAAADPGARAGDDAELMLAYGRGDPQAFARLYERHKGATYRYFLRHLRGRAPLAEELHQDLWLKVVGARHRYAPDARFTTWLYTLARHRLVDHWRAAGAAGFAVLTDVDAHEAAEYVASDDSLEPLQVALNGEAARRLVDALQDVPAKQRDAFLLHVEGGLSLAEIAALAGEPEETIKSRLRYAYRKLRAALEDLQ